MTRRRLAKAADTAARVILAALLLGVLALAALLWGSPAQAAAASAVPEVSAGYRLAVQRAAGEHFGLAAPSARLAAQIQQESGWRPTAQSLYAQGLAQFTPATAKWLPDICPELAGFDPWDALQSVRAMACYDAWLYRRSRALGDSTGLDDCSRWHFALRAYNGGEGWLMRERRLALAAGDNPNDWATVARHRARAGWAHRENIDYPARILGRWEPRYRAAGWPGASACPAGLP